jgi:tetratricopeptide (TPR) repeat protein
LEKADLPAKRAAEFPEYADWLRAARRGDKEVTAALAKVDRWAADRFREWYGEKKDADTHFAHALSAARRGEPAAEGRLLELARRGDVPAIVRATCLNELSQYESAAVSELAIKLLQDQEPIMRLTAVMLLERLPDDQIVKRISPLLSDPIRSVRAEAGRVLARLDEHWLNGPQRTARTKAIDEFKSGLLANNDRAIAHMGLGILAERQRNETEARKAYETALSLEPNTAGPRANLAAVLEQQAETMTDRVAADELRERIAKLRREELELLARDAKYVPENAAIRYRYGLSLYLHDRLDEAQKELEAAVQLAPNTADYVLGLALFYQKQQRFKEALQQVRRLVELRPNDPSYQQLLEEIQIQAAKQP